MASKKNNLQSSGSPAPKRSPAPKVSVADTVHSPNGASIGRVVNYENFVRGNRANHVVEGFWFDQDQFENLIDDWADFEDILIIFQVSESELDTFCNAIYHQPAREVFARLRAISRTIARKTIDQLAKSGNATAVAIAKNHFAQLKDDDGNKPINITIKNDLD